jgi:DNA repair exonuclease SbcCD ATPase subunit
MREENISIVSNYNQFELELLGTFEDREKQIDDLCAVIKHTIDLRVEQLKDQLDDLFKELSGQLNGIKAKVYEELDKMSKESETKINESQEFSNKMESMLENFDANKQQLESDIYKCQDYIDELKALDENFHRILRKVSFDPSDWQPDASCIGVLNFADILSDNEDDQSDEEDADTI